jgi:hypothetical protein
MIAEPLPPPWNADEEPMKSRDLGFLLFGLAGLYSLLLSLLGAAQVLLLLSAGAAGAASAAGASVAAGGQLRIQAGLVNGAVSVLLHLGFGILLLAGRRGLALWLLGEEEAKPDRDAPGPQARGFAVIGVSLLGVLLLARVVTALSYAASLLWLRADQQRAADVSGWTIAGILVDLLLAAGGALLIGGRRRVAARLLAAPPPAGGGRQAASADADADVARWQLPAVRLLGLAVLVWHLPELASAASAFVKWWLRPMGFDLRAQAVERLPPAIIGFAAGLYLLLAFPAGLGGIARRLQPPRSTRE